MKKLINTLIFTLLIVNGLLAEVYVLEGVYQGKDVYVQNPFSSEGVGFCIYEVTVNGKVTSDEINSSAFAVDLAMYEFNMGDEVIITIRSKSDCEPKVINPNAITPKSSCEVLDVTITDDGELTFKTIGEKGKLPFIVEQFKWNKWVQMGSVLGNGEKQSSYSLNVSLPSGENRIRIKQKDYSGERIAQELTVNMSKPEVMLLSKKVKDRIEFTGETHFELFNEYGQLVKNGYRSSVDVSNLKKGVYYLNFEKAFGTELNKK